MSNNDKIYSYLRSIGLTGSINDMLYKWYSLIGTDEWQYYYLTRTYLFALGQQGVWYDPSNLSTLFQDSAGTVPVTAMEQPVGRMLDLSLNGNHAFQATTTKRGVVSRRVNLLTKTEQFDDAVWVKVGVVNTSNATAAPDGTQSADKQSPETGLAVAACFSLQAIPKPPLAIRYKSVAFAKRGEHDAFRLVLVSGSSSMHRAEVTVSLVSGEITNPATAFGDFSSASAAVSDAGNGWYRVELTCTTDESTSLVFRTYGGFSGGGLGDGVSGIYLWGASLTLATDAHLPYQSVNTATDYDDDSNKFPTYISLDGVDDAYQTNSIDFTGTDKMTVWAGITKLSDAAVAVVTELGNSLPPGSFYVAAPNSVGPTFGFASKGTIPVSPSPSGYAAPISSVVTGIGNIGADIATCRVNGVSTTLNNDQGTGNYSNYPMYIGARSGTSLFFNGRFYGLIVAGANYPLSQTESVEYYMKRKMMLP